MISNTVMIIDDTPANLKLLQDILLAEQYRVMVFPSGRLALKAALKNPPDVVLMDIMMPEMDGYETCQQFKKQISLKDIPIIFISALSNPQDKVKAFVHGGVDYITKPFQAEEVIARVRTHVKLRGMQKSLQRENYDLEELVIAKVREVTVAQLAVVSALAKLTESRDNETGKHSERVQSFCKILAEELFRNSPYMVCIDQEFIENIYSVAPLHDIGKVGIPDTVLLKPGKYTPDEFEIMKSHVLIGSNTLIDVRKKYPENSYLNMAIEITRYHHEKWNGTGYPEGLKGDSIPLSARILAVADVYDALRSARPYKQAFTHQVCVTIILEDSGKQFDPEIIQAFICVESEFDRIFQELSE